MGAPGSSRYLHHTDVLLPCVSSTILELHSSQHAMYSVLFCYRVFFLSIGFLRVLL